MVAIPNHHFFQWVNQLEQAGHEVHWFDITDGAGFSNKIKWVKQCNGWKLKWDFPFRASLKNKLPRVYRFIQYFNERKLEPVFQNYLNQIQPDIVHSFEMKLSGLPIFPIMKNNNIPWIYSSWGSDVFFYKELGVSTEQVTACLQRVNYLITDCKRDFNLLQQLGYKNTFLGVFPGNGGISFTNYAIKPCNQRKYILIKGYEDGVGKAIAVLKAFQYNLWQLISSYEIVIFSADKEVIDFVRNSRFYDEFQPLIFPRNEFVPNETLLEIMNDSVIYIGNSISDGMPNSLLEAMGMGAFPIQSNPGGVTEEVITHGKNGFLISDCLDSEAISKLISEALNNAALRQTAQEYNTSFILENYDRNQLKDKIVTLYNSLKNN
jgi:glycosyltransferase involved in cell wall biosynthesis